MQWHIITGEYPPKRGGVSDYTYLLARALAEAGEDVHIWTPAVSSDAARTGTLWSMKFRRQLKQRHANAPEQPASERFEAWVKRRWFVVILLLAATLLGALEVR